MKKRTQSREHAVQMMYQAEMVMGESGEYNLKEIAGTFWRSFPPMSDDVRNFAQELFYGSFPLREEHDRIISDFLKDSWSLERLGEMEKSILRVAIYELLNKDTPVYAVLDDYVTITKRFSDEKTASFVNGVLDKIRNTFLPDKKSKG